MRKKMVFKGIKIENFRLFKKFETNNFGRVNLISGSNNSGKTTLLEALFLNLGPTNPALSFNINARRGLDRFSSDDSTIPYLFNHIDVSSPVKFSVNTVDDEIHKLSINLLEPSSYEINISELDAEFDSSELSQINDSEHNVTVEYEYIPHNSDPIISRAIIKPEGNIEIERDIPQVYHQSVFLSEGKHKPTPNESKRYDQLNKENNINLFDDALRIIVPDLVRTSLGIENNRTLIYGDIGYGLIPLSLLGSGSNTLASIILSLTHSRNGVILIDEIENGFHHSMHEKVWEIILDFVNKFDCQIFATTHSREFIEAAISAFDDEKDFDFRFHRFDKKNEEPELITFERDQIVKAIESGWEVR